MKDIHEQMKDWSEKAASEGLSGHARLVGQTDTAISAELNVAVGGPLETDNATKVPLELIPYIKEILHERDRELKEKFFSQEKIPTVDDKASASLAAIEIIRERHKDELNANPA